MVQEDKNGEFVREAVDVEQFDLPYVKNISLIHKVREVQALVGFSRLEPLDDDNPNNSGKIKKVSIKEDSTNWYRDMMFAVKAFLSSWTRKLLMYGEQIIPGYSVGLINSMKTMLNRIMEIYAPERYLLNFFCYIRFHTY